MPQRNWLITGVSRGFGRIMTEQLLARGDRIRWDRARPFGHGRPEGQVWRPVVAGRARLVRDRVDPGRGVYILREWAETAPDRSSETAERVLPLRTSPRSPFERSIVPSSNSEFPSFAVQMRTQRIIVLISLRLVEERARSVAGRLLPSRGRFYRPAAAHELRPRPTL